MLKLLMLRLFFELTTEMSSRAAVVEDAWLLLEMLIIFAAEKDFVMFRGFYFNSFCPPALFVSPPAANSAIIFSAGRRPLLKDIYAKMGR